MNPIHKIVGGGGRFGLGGQFKPFRRWGYTCPDCGETDAHPSAHSTRKKAKDLYHHHRLNVHGGPGKGV